MSAAHPYVYMNCLRPPTQRNNGVCSGRRVKVAVLTVAVLVSVALIITVVVLSFPRRSLRLHCDVGWELNGTSCYYFSTSMVSWSQSRRECQKASGDLVKIESREEQRFLFGKVRHLMSEDEEKFWIGLTDSETEGKWKWIDGSALDPSLSFWYRYGVNIQPDNRKKSKWSIFSPEGEDCGQIGKKTGSGFEEKCWFDQHCESLSRFICEKTASPESP